MLAFGKPEVGDRKVAHFADLLFQFAIIGLAHLFLNLVQHLPFRRNE